MGGDLLRDQVALGDLDLLVLGVAGQPDDLHPVEQRRRHVHRVRGGDEHDVRQVVIDLQVVVVEVQVLLGIEHLQQRRRRIAAPVVAHLVHLVEEEQRVRRLGLLHPLDDLARHRADVGPPVAADLRLVADAAQRHPHEVAPGRPGDGLAERGLADARRPHQAEDRAAQLVGALLHGEVLEDPLLDLLQAEVVGVEDLLGELDVLLDLGALLPRDAEHPLQVVANDRGLGRHRAHGPELLQLAHGLLPRLLAERGLLDPLFELAGFVAAVLGLAQLLLDRLELLVQVVLALGLLHLPLDPAADALLHLQDADLRLHVGVDPLQPLADPGDLEQFLLVGDLQRQMGGDGIGELARVVDLVDRDQHLRRDLLVQLDVLLELPDHRPGQRLQLADLALLVVEGSGFRLEERLALGEALDPRPLPALDQHLHGAVGKLQQLQHGRDRPDQEDVFGRRVVLRGVLLRDQQNLPVVLHDVLERPHRLLAADEQRHDHVREHHDVAKGKDGIQAWRFGHDTIAFCRWLTMAAKAVRRRRTSRPASWRKVAA